MKTKKLSKKLSLNKKTIADLKSNDKVAIHGGADTPRSWPYTGCFACLTGTCDPQVGC